MRLLLVGEHALLLQGLTKLLEDQLGAEVRTADWPPAVGVVQSWRPDILIAECSDVPARDGLLADLCELAGDVPVVVVAPGEPEQFLAAIRCGARGFVGRHADAEHLLGALRTVRGGEWGIPRSMIGALVGGYLAHVAMERASSAAGLTERERQIIRLLIRGRSTKQVGGELFVSESTVRADIRALAEKLGVSNRMQVVTEALRRRLVDLD